MKALALLVAEPAAGQRLAEALAARGVTPRIDVAGALVLDLARRQSDADLVVNLVDDRAAPPLAAFTMEYLAYLADLEVPTVNGLDAFVVGFSIVRQLALLGHLGVRHPAARVVATRAGIPLAIAAMDADETQARVVGTGPLVVWDGRSQGEVLRVEYVAGREVAARAGDEPVRPDRGVMRLGEEITRTAGIEFGGVSFTLEQQQAVCVGIDLRVETDAGVEALAAHVLRRAGVPA